MSQLDFGIPLLYSGKYLSSFHLSLLNEITFFATLQEIKGL